MERKPDDGKAHHTDVTIRRARKDNTVGCSNWRELGEGGKERGNGKIGKKEFLVFFLNPRNSRDALVVACRSAALRWLKENAKR